MSGMEENATMTDVIETLLPSMEAPVTLVPRTLVPMTPSPAPPPMQTTDASLTVVIILVILGLALVACVMLIGMWKRPVERATPEDLPDREAVALALKRFKTPPPTPRPDRERRGSSSPEMSPVALLDSPTHAHSREPWIDDSHNSLAPATWSPTHGGGPVHNTSHNHNPLGMSVGRLDANHVHALHTSMGLPPNTSIASLSVAPGDEVTRWANRSRASCCDSPSGFARRGVSPSPPRRISPVPMLAPSRARPNRTAYAAAPSSPSSPRSPAHVSQILSA